MQRLRLYATCTKFKHQTHKVVSKQNFAKAKQWDIFVLVIDWTKGIFNSKPSSGGMFTRYTNYQNPVSRPRQKC